MCDVKIKLMMCVQETFELSCMFQGERLSITEITELSS